MRRLLLAALVLLSVPLAVRWGLSWMPGPDVPACADTDVLTPMPSPELRALGRQLLLRQSGMAEKEFFLELHRADTVFDDCRRSSSPALDQAHVDLASGPPSAVSIRGDRITVVRGSAGLAGPLEQLPVQVAAP